METNNIKTEAKSGKCSMNYKCISMAVICVMLIAACVYFYKQHKNLETIVINQQEYIAQLALKVKERPVQRNIHDYFDDIFDNTLSVFKLPSFNLGNTHKYFGYNTSEDVSANSNYSSYYSHLSSVANDKEYVVKIALLGLDKEEVNITISKNIMTIKTTDLEDTKETTQKAKASTNKFKQSIKIPRDVDQTLITTELKNGLLIITMPRMNNNSSSETKIIPIQ